MRDKSTASKNAKVVIPLAVAVWILGILVFETGAPAVAEAAFFVAFMIVVPLVVLYLLTETGWRTLSKSYPQRRPFNGRWQLCATGQMAMVSVDHPDYQRSKARFLGMLRVGASDEALYLSTLVSKLPVLSAFFPTVQILWTAVSSARGYEAGGWVAQQSGALLQATYDPNYTGTFLELQIGSPTVFIQLPRAILGDHVSRLPAAPG